MHHEAIGREREQSLDWRDPGDGSSIERHQDWQGSFRDERSWCLTSRLVALLAREAIVLVTSPERSYPGVELASRRGRAPVQIDVYGCLVSFGRRSARFGEIVFHLKLARRLGGPTQTLPPRFLLPSSLNWQAFLQTRICAPRLSLAHPKSRDSNINDLGSLRRLRPVVVALRRIIGG